MPDNFSSNPRNLKNMKIAFFSTQSYDRDYFNRFNTGYTYQFFDVLLDENTAELARGNTVVCTFVNDRLTAPVLRILSANGVKLIALRCAGFNNLDLETAAALGIKVVRVPAYSPHAVAEHAVALIMTLNRKTHKAYNRVREGNFSLERLTGFDLYGKTVGIIGLGKIGEVFARIMRGFGCKVQVYDIVKNPEMENQGITYVSLEDLIKSSDIISLHCPLTDKTRYIIDPQRIRQMKKGVMLINTGRGALIDTKAVMEGLKTGQIGYLGLDVYEQEETLFFRDLSENIIQDDTIMRLMSFPNVLITSHQAFFTDEALSQIAKITLKNISEFDSGSLLTNEVRE